MAQLILFKEKTSWTEKLRFASDLGLDQAQRDALNDPLVDINEFWQDAKVVRMQFYAVPEATTAGPDTPVSFDWGATESWDGSNPDINPQITVNNGAFQDFINYGNLAGVNLRVSLTTSAASVNFGSGGTGSFAIFKQTGETYTVRFQFNGGH